MPDSLINPDNDTASLIAAESAPATIAGGIVSQTLLRTAGGKAMTFHFDAGQTLSEHTNPNHALLSPLKGRVEVQAGGKDFQLAPGDLLHFPPHLPHAVKAPEAASFLLILLQP